MKFLVVYATTEGQTRKIARFVADRLSGHGHSVELWPASEGAELAPRGFDGVVLGGSLHLGHYQKSLEDYVRAHRATLGAVPTLFLPVSLSAAGEASDVAAAEACARDFCEALEWTPTRTVQVAGAFRFGEYDFFKSWAMRWIARRKEEPEPSGGSDKEYTDWDALGAAIDAWVGRIVAGT